MNSRINTILNGSPMGFYTTLQNLISANPNSGIYLIQENGHIYAWTKNGSEATDLGVYNGVNIYQGNIRDLGYTTFEACKNDGYYSFGTADLSLITDKPSNLSGGGIIQVFKKSSASGSYIFQFINDIYGNQWFRYNSDLFKQNIDISINNYINKCLQYRGNVIELGFNKFENCKNDGYYSFKISDLPSITDKPTDLNGGGMLQVFTKANNGFDYIFQFINDANGNQWFRNNSSEFIKIIDYNKSNYLFYNGNIIDNGFTSFVECKNNGYYSFSTANVENITDKPSNLNQGGVVRVEKNASGGAIYQTICDNNGNQWFRHDTNPFVQTINMTSPEPEPEPSQHIANWVALGDSITEGYYSYLDKQGQPQLGLNQNYSWTNYVKKLAPFNLTNKAIGGTGFVYGGNNSSINQNAIETIKTINFKDFDLCTISYGVNDWKYNQILGTFNDDIETGGTFYSNMRKTIEYILNDNPNIKIIVTTPLNCKFGDYNTNWGLGYEFSNNGNLQDIFDAMVEVCDYYGIEYIDMTHYSSVNRQNITQILLDNVHPSQIGHKLLGYELYKKINF